jgi:hypothetical protein
MCGRVIAAEFSPSFFLLRAHRSACLNSDVLHQWVFDFFYANAAYDALDKRTIRMNGWGLCKKGSEIIFVFDLLL